MSAALGPVEVFCTYVHEDEVWLRKLETHLSLLKRQGLLSLWYDRLISPGMNWAEAIDTRLERASVILLLVSADFFASDYCYGVEMKRALERQKAGQAQVIPILVRPVDWTNAPFAHLHVLPTNATPITMWPDADFALTSIVTGIRQVLEGLPLFASRNFPVTFPAIGNISHPRNPFFPGRAREIIQVLHALTNVTSAEGPQNYIPFPRDPLFQPRPGEFERLESLLLGQEHSLGPARVSLVGVAGMGGVGKTQLAVEIAYRFLDQQRFLGGIFWTPAFGTSRSSWQQHLAELAFQSGYLPPDDDLSNPENEARRTRHLTRYLASNGDALLILDNVDDPMLINTFLPSFAGKELACALLYTSRVTQAPTNVTIHYVESLPEPEALRLLLQTTRPELLKEVLANNQSEEADTARCICKIVGYLPLALVHLRSFLTQDRQVSLVRLKEVLEARGILSIAEVLTTTFQLSWEQVQSEEARRLFLLAAYFPEAAPIPLWLLGLVAGLGEEGDIFEPLGQARLHLQKLSLLEELSDLQVRLHPLVCAFAQHLLHEERETDHVLCTQAGQKLVEAFCDLTLLDLRARRIGYMTCLEQVRIARDYAIRLSPPHAHQLIRLERIMDQESYLLANKHWWPETFPALFYQQLSNKATETGPPFPSQKSPLCWIRQAGSTATTNQALLRIFSGHTSAVWSVAFSPDGRLVLTGSLDQTARLWDRSTGQIYVTFQGHTDAVSRVAFSPNGRLVLTGSLDQTARLWDSSTGELRVILQGHTDQVWSVAFSPDGQLVLTGSSDQTARLWDSNTGQLHTVLQGHTGRVNSVAFSPDGRLVLTGSDDQTARLWNSSTGQLHAVLQDHTDKVNSVAFSPDGRLVLTGSSDQTARLWESSTGRLHTTLQGHTDIVLSVAFSPNGRLVLTGSDDQTARLWDSSTGQLHATLQGHIGLVRYVAFSPDGRLAFTGDTVGTAQLWDSNTGQLYSTLLGHASHVQSVAFSSDGRLVLTGSTDQTARLWNTTSHWSHIAVQGHTHYVNSVAFSPDGKLLLTGSSDQTARLWDSGTGELRIILQGHTSRLTSVAFSSDGKWLLTGSSDGTARLWDSGTGELRIILQGHTDIVNSVAFSPDGQLVLTGSSDGTARLWDSGTGQLHAVLQGHTQLVGDVAFSPDGRLVLSGSFDETARLWESNTGELRAILQGHTGPVNSVAFSPDGQLVLTGSSDGTARLWDSNTGQLHAILQGHRARVGLVAFSPDGRLVLTSDLRGWTFFWQLELVDKPQCLGLSVIPGTVSSLFWQDTTHLLFTDHGGGSGRPFVYHIHLEGPCWPENRRSQESYPESH